jgi:hypothetical protein
VFIQTLDNELAIGILAVLAAVAALIQFDRLDLAIVPLAGDLLLTIVIVAIAPVCLQPTGVAIFACVIRVVGEP